jgi:hypothetical protein
MPGILATWEAEIGKTVVPSQLRQKCLQDPISTGKKLDVVACTCHSSDT